MGFRYAVLAGPIDDGAVLQVRHILLVCCPARWSTLEGTVKEFHWTNPHSWIFVNVAEAEGRLVEWPIELGSPGGLTRQGWVPKTLVPGMNVKIMVRPLKDGKPGGQFLTVWLPDGKQFGDPSTRGGGNRGREPVD